MFVLIIVNGDCYVSLSFVIYPCLSHRLGQCVYCDRLYDLDESSDRGQHTEEEKGVMLRS